MTRMGASDIAAVASFARDFDERAAEGVASAAALDSMLDLVRADTIEWGITDERQRRIIEIRHYPPLLILRGTEPYLATANDPFWAARPSCPICGPARLRNSGALKISALPDMSHAHPQHFVCAGVPVAHQLNLFMRPRDILPRHVAFSRSDGIDFDDRDGQVLELAGVFIVQQARLAEARHDAVATIAALEAAADEVSRGVIIVRANGRPTLVSAAARRLLEGYFGWPADARRLPPAIERWLAELTVLEQSNERRGSGRPLRRAAASGELQMRSVAVDGQLVILLDETRTSTFDPRKVLTPREREILEGVAQGLTNSQIAEQLWVSPATVGKHLENAFAKLGVHSRAAAVMLAHRLSSGSSPTRQS